MSSALRSWNPLSQLSGRWTSREPQWPVDSPGFGAQRVGSSPPSNPLNPPAPYHTHPSSHHPMHMAFHSLWMPLAHLNNRKHKQIYMCVCVCVRERLADKSGGFELTVTLLPNKNVIAAVIAIVVLAQTTLVCVSPRRDEDSGSPHPWILILIPHKRFYPHTNLLLFADAVLSKLKTVRNLDFYFTCVFCLLSCQWTSPEMRKAHASLYLFFLLFLECMHWNVEQKKKTPDKKRTSLQCSNIQISQCSDKDPFWVKPLVLPF